jgi:hypothetical protein
MDNGFIPVGRVVVGFIGGGEVDDILNEGLSRPKDAPPCSAEAGLDARELVELKKGLFP